MSRQSGPGSRGYRGPLRGEAVVVPALDEFRGTSSQVCGLYPFGVGAGTPMTGVPLGRNLLTNATLCCDPISWFQRANLISNPSAFVLGKPGLGKSTVVRRMALGLYGYGVLPLILGDLKPDYVDLVKAVDGQVLPLGPGRGSLNVLDPGEARDAARRLTGQAREQVLADAHARRHAVLAGLITIARAAPPRDREESVLDRALRVLDDKWDHRRGAPVPQDLLDVIRAAPDDVRLAALDRGDRAKYDDVVEDLEASLVGIIGGGRLGDMFARPTTTPMRRDRPVVFDVSGIGDSQPEQQAAALLACWSYGFGTVNVSHALADAGLEPRRLFLVVLDELWRILRAGSGMVDRADALTRLNRREGVGIVYVTHSMADLNALPTEADRMKARGFVERAGMVICGGLPAAEMPALRSVAGFSAAEEQLLVGWQDPPSFDLQAGAETAPPGRGNFLVKVGGRPGIPFHLRLTEIERDLNNTNKLWQDVSRIGPVTDLPPVDPELAADPVRVDTLPPVPAGAR